MELHCQFKNTTIVLLSNDNKCIQLGETFQALTRFEILLWFTFKNITIEIMYFVIYLFWIVFYIAFYL
jgi:hypothetical protein